MNILETIRADLCGATVERQHDVAASMGVPFGTLRKIIDGRTANPRFDTVTKAVEHYRKHPLRRKNGNGSNGQ